MALTKQEKVSENLIIQKTVSFSFDQIEEYELMFKNLVEIGATNSHYNDICWYFRDYKFILGTSKFEFKFHSKLKMWEAPIKAFVVVKLNNKTNPRSIRIKSVIKAIHVSSGFEDLKELKLYFDQLLPENKQQFKSLVSELIEFMNFSNEKIEQIKHIVNVGHSSNLRILPPLNDLILLNEAIERFIEEWDIEEQRLYLPLVLYWLITNIIPMRPLEFCIIPYDCIPENNNELLLKIPRLKEGQSYMEDPFIDEIPIPHIRIIQLINRYKEISINSETPVFLFNYETYRHALGHNYGLSRKKNLKKQFLHKQLEYIRDRFYDDIVRKRYGLINQLHQKIKLGDTRHLAICNMLFMGYSPITIKRLAYHKDITSQNPYAAHMDLYTQSRVIQLTEIFRRTVRKLWSGDTRNINKVSERLRDRRIYKKEDFKYLWELKHGSYCFYTPLDCPTDDCRSCPYLYVPKEHWEEALPWIAEESDRLQAIIQTILAKMESLRKFVSDESELKNKAGELESVVHKKALVDAYRYEMSRNGWESNLKEQRVFLDNKFEVDN